MARWLGMVVALTACGKGADTAAVAEDVVDVLTARGSYGVGYVAGEVVYPDPVVAGDRSLRLAIWYPTDATSGVPVDKYGGLFPAEEDVWDAPAVAAGGARPVFVFSHGSQAYAEAASFLMTHLASHGWLVVAPDHTGNTTFDGADRTTAIYLQRPRDISAALDHLEALPASDPIAALVGGPIVAAGHSFGGYTIHALAGATYDVDGACAEDPGGSFCAQMTPEIQAELEAGARLAAVVSMAPGDEEKFGAGLGAIDRPILHMTGALDDPARNDLVWAGLQGVAGARRVDVAEGGHNLFTDFSGSLDSPGELIEPEEGWRIVRAYVLAAALEATGDGSVAAVLDGSVPVSELATLTP